MRIWVFILCLVVLGAVVYLITRRSLFVSDGDTIQADAMRFARLLVAEIKSFNQSKIETGKRNNDIYSQLESEIDAARMKYEKRIDLKLTEKDYFDAALVELLADGDATKMGSRYAQCITIDGA